MTFAQNAERRAPARESKQPARARTEEARKRAEMREAVVALMETADAARSFADLYDKVFVQAEAADALWPFEERAARSFLRRAWDATTAPGVVRAFKRADETDDDAIEAALSARREVISVASKHDPRLAETYMKGLTQGISISGDEGRVAHGGDEDSQTSHVWRQPSWESLQRLNAAHELLEEGAYESAAALVAPVISEGVSRELVNFITALRAHAPREGDALYLRLSERTRLDSRTSANDVLLLSKPIVSPDLEIFVNEDGSVQLRQVNYSDAAMSSAFSGAPVEVRRAFYATAAAVLMRPPQQTADNAGTNAEASAIYFTIGRLLPFFEREAAQYAPALQARMNALSVELGSGRSQSLSSNMGTLSLSPGNPVDPLASQLEALGRAPDATSRDRVRLRIVTAAARRELWERARAVANETEDAETKREALRVIAIYQVMGVGRAYDDEPEGFERAAEFVRLADVPPEFRAAGLAQASELAAARGKRALAESFLDEAIMFANQAERSGRRNLTALALVARSAAHTSSPHTWDVLASLVAYANEVKDLAGVELQFPVTNRPTDDDEDAVYVPEESFNLVNVFEDAARADSARTLREARSLKDEVERAFITIAVAREALGKSSVKAR